ncbi:tetratricopeptide repeat protein, partial [Achromobacter sp. GbtcB20]
AQGRFPWQSRAELDLLDAVAAGRAALAASERGAGGSLLGGNAPDPNAAPLARDLLRLGELHRQQGRTALAQECFEESTALRQRLLGDAHPDTRASRSALAALLRESGRLREARAQYELLVEHCVQDAGAEHAETLSARSGLAATLAALDEFPRALALHEQVVEACERLFGPGHIVTLDALAGQ